MVKLNINIPESFYKEEIRDGYKVSSKMKKVWAVELDLLNEFMRVCEKHKLKFYAAGGTILGAVRHKGFIPWDDDIDLMMPRCEYNRLCEIAPKEFSHPYFFQTNDTDPGSLRGHAQLRNSETTGILKNEFGNTDSINMGIFIDIFPLDNVPDGEFERNSYLKELSSLLCIPRFIMQSLHTYKLRFRRNLIFLFWDFLKYLYYRSFYSKRQILDKCKSAYVKYEKMATIYNTRSSQKFVLTPIYIERFVMDKADFSGVEYGAFEMLRLPMPSGYENILNHTYGNWKKFVVGTSEHGGVIFDTEKSYTEYIK